MKAIYGECTLKVPDDYILALIELAYLYGFNVGEKLDDYFSNWGQQEWVQLNTMEFLELTDLLARLQVGDIYGR